MSIFRNRSTIKELMDMPYRYFNTLYYKAHLISVSEAAKQQNESEALVDEIENMT